MKSIKNARALARQHEFELVDDEIEGRRMSLNRAHRAALHPGSRGLLRADAPTQRAGAA